MRSTTDRRDARRARRGQAALTLALLAMGVIGAARCGGQAPAAAGPPPAMPVETIVLDNAPVERTSEFVGIIKSRSSTTVQPQVEGIITRIAVASGARVKPGQVLMEIDGQRQQALVATLESQRAAREAELGLARQQAERARALLDAGAGSQMEYDQAAAALAAGTAQVRALTETVREQRVELNYYRVSAPTGGIVGDIPVREGDRVTRSTVLTTIDRNDGLELYVNIPVSQATGLRPGLPLRIIDDKGKVIGTYVVGFISPSVDDQTQTVLVKSTVELNGKFRTDQFVRVQVVWSTAPGLTVPVVSVNRINGQYFAFVAETGPNGQMVARQRAVTLGPVVGNDYVVHGGLKAGERLIVTGIQKVVDGVPVKVTDKAPEKS